MTAVISPLAVLGNPTSAGSYAAGQEQAPRALRAAGLMSALSNAGRDVRDAGDLPMQVWRPDREHPYVQNRQDVVDNLNGLRDQVESVLATDSDVLVVGGNCLGALACAHALRYVYDVAPAVLYFDRHLDCNTPASTTDGALDWMGMAHAFGLPGADDLLCQTFRPSPLLDADHVAFLGVDLDLATDWERAQVIEHQLRYWTSKELADSPQAVVGDALAYLPEGPLLVHVDVDVLDFTDIPLSENTDGRNTGPVLSALQVALETVQRQRRPRILSVGELNPTRSMGDPDALPRFISMLAAVLGTPPEARN